MHTLNADKTENVMTSTMLQIGASFSEMEVRQTHQRLKSGRAKFVATGGKLGRNVGTNETKEMILSKHKDLVKFIRNGQSVRNIMKLTLKSNGTILKVKKLLVA